MVSFANYPVGEKHYLSWRPYAQSDWKIICVWGGKDVLGSEQWHGWWHPPETPHCPVCRTAIPPPELRVALPHLPASPQHPCFSKDTHHHAHTLPLLASVHSLCPVWERLRHLKSHGLQPVFNSLWLPWVKFRLKHPSLTASFPQNKSLQSCISHRLILACFEVSELTWKQGCFGSLCEGLAVHTISDTQNVKALTGRAAWGDPKLEPDRVEAK